MLVSGIKSRPVYSGLVIDPYARRHVFALAGEGALALLKKPELRDADIRARAEILYVPEGSNHAAALQACGITNCWQAPTIPTLLTRLEVMLSTAHMGLRLYTSGTEGFMGQVIQVAIDATSGIASATYILRALQGHYRKRDHQSSDLQSLRPDPAGSRSLFTPHRCFPGRLHRCRSAG